MFLCSISQVPGKIVYEFIKDSMRVLRPGGVLVFADDNPG